MESNTFHKFELLGLRVQHRAKRDTSPSISFAIVHSSCSVCMRFSTFTDCLYRRTFITLNGSCKTFFIAALLAMQHEQIMVLLGSMGALTIKTIVSIVIGRLFQSVPAQFRTSTLPIGEYAAVTLLLFFGLQSIREAWKLPPTVAKTDHRGIQKSKEPAEEMSVKLSPIEVLGESFSLVFFCCKRMGRPFNACHIGSWCSTGNIFSNMFVETPTFFQKLEQLKFFLDWIHAKVSIGSGKCSHFRPSASNIYLSTRRVISLMLHIQKTVWINLRSFVFGVRCRHVFRIILT
ncbi:protein PAM71-homolog, chloroplastic-like isoform X3 [Primulina tabacum]|uniref:protein PAM71-homolog, chloroplastic-like isoform X3 n=1 Tax=Primulina tabacum TaxID=48773 RepID=UPI003F5A8AB3